MRKPGGMFRWKWRMGIFDNAAQVANALHVLKGMSVEESWAAVMRVQAEREGMDTAPGVIWDEARRRLRHGTP